MNAAEIAVAGLAEIELEYRRERQAAGIAVAKSRGVYQGSQTDTAKAKPTRAGEVQERGCSVTEIANAIEVSKRTVFLH